MPTPKSEPTSQTDLKTTNSSMSGDGQGGATDPKASEPSASGDPIDKHGEPAINKGRYDRDMKAKDDEIAALKAQLEEANGKVETGDKALKEVEQLKEQLADEKVTHSLDAAGCVNAKAAKALLPDYDGSVEKLKEDCPYLFGQHQTGSTGGRPGGAPSSREELARKAREAAGTTRYYQTK